MRTIPFNIVVRPGGIDVNPTFANVPNSDQDVQLRWNIVGATLPTSGCFSWKNNPSGAPTVDCPTSPDQNVLLSSSYKNDAGQQRIWQYKVTIIVDKKKVTIDPEINNEPPSG